MSFQESKNEDSSKKRKESEGRGRMGERESGVNKVDSRLRGKGPGNEVISIITIAGFHMTPPKQQAKSLSII